MALSIVVQKAIPPTAAFLFLLEADPGTVVRVRVTLKVGGNDDAEFALKVGDIATARARFHDLHVGGLLVAEVTDWGGGPPGAAIELTAVCAAGDVAKDHGVIV